MYQKQVRLFKWGYIINGKENQTEKKKIDHIDTTQIDLGLNIDTNILNVKCISV